MGDASGSINVLEHRLEKELNNCQRREEEKRNEFEQEDRWRKVRRRIKKNKNAAGMLIDCLSLTTLQEGNKGDR